MMIDGEQHRRSVEAFFSRWEHSWEELRSSYGELFADDCVWENSGCPTTRGLDEALAVMVDPAHEANGLDTIKVDIVRIGAVGEIVWSERVDHLRRADGSVIVSVPLVGVMRFDDAGRLRHWREYFDPRPMFEAMEGQAGS